MSTELRVRMRIGPRIYQNVNLIKEAVIAVVYSLSKMHNQYYVR
jgi:hypothetical protein